tara:strand:+ start:1073 stop:1432 length:360 start_codon:yes stop_codon:yes gene_type:complete
VGYVLIILLFFSKIFRIPLGWDRLGIILGLGGFVLLTGGKASVIRASIMAGLYVLAPILNRQINAWNIISSAGFLILLWNPALIADTGFFTEFRCRYFNCLLFRNIRKYSSGKTQSKSR